jgi:hypothetical protein
MLLEAGADTIATNSMGLTALELATQRGLRDVVRVFERGGVEAPPPLSASHVEGVRAGDIASIDSALLFLQTQDPENTDVLAALQERVAVDPAAVLPRTRMFGLIAQMMCSHPVNDAPELSIERRLAAVRQANAGVPVAENYPFVMCISSLQKSTTAPPKPRLPDKPKGEDRELLLARAQRLFDESDSHTQGRHEADDIVRRLVVTDPDHAAAQLLAARLSIAHAIEMPDQEEVHIRIAANHLERALQVDPGYADALLVYGDLLRFERNEVLHDLVVARARGSIPAEGRQ